MPQMIPPLGRKRCARCGSARDLKVVTYIRQDRKLSEPWCAPCRREKLGRLSELGHSRGGVADDGGWRPPPPGEDDPEQFAQTVKVPRPPPPPPSGGWQPPVPPSTASQSPRRGSGLQRPLTVRLWHVLVGALALLIIGGAIGGAGSSGDLDEAENAATQAQQEAEAARSEARAAQERIAEKDREIAALRATTVPPTTPPTTSRARTTATTVPTTSRATTPPAPATTSAPSAGVYYANCAAARAAGAAPLSRGEPGYRSALDADNDGVACA
jgi:type II secretory pathway pseudopilin PulG